MSVLDVNHPGFHDPEYRRRRDQIAESARRYVFPGPVERVQYTSAEQGVWSSINQILRPMHDELACDMYLRSRPIAQLDPERIPQLDSINKRLLWETGFHLTPVDGLVTPRLFLSTLAEGRMLCTQYIRHHSVPLYTPEPDVVHELLGHVVMFFDRDYCDLNRDIGKAARVLSDDSLIELERLYWYSIEFGLVRDLGVTRAFGAGLLSSAGEMGAMGSVTHRPFVPEEIVSTPYDTMHMQSALFCADSVDHMFREIRRYIGHLRRRENV